MSTYPGKAGHDREGTRLRVGDLVLCQRPEGRPVGSWVRYQDKVGRVVVVNNHGETGLTWALDSSESHNDSADSWFVPAELVRLPPEAQREG